MAEVKNTTERRGHPSQPSIRMRSRPSKKSKTSSAFGQAPCLKQYQVFHTSLRQLQAKMVSDSHQVQELIQPLKDTENGFMKELECFLSQQDIIELRRKELLHKQWTEQVWFPLQKRVEERVFSCSPTEVKKLQSLVYSDYLHHSNSKSKTVYFKDTWYLYPCEKKTASSWETGNKCTWKKPQELSQSYVPLDKCLPSQVNHLPLASSHHPASTSIKIPRKDDTAQNKSDRLDTIPCHIDATSDGRCHQSRCWFSRWARRQQSKSLQQLN